MRMLISEEVRWRGEVRLEEAGGTEELAAETMVWRRMLWIE